MLKDIVGKDLIITDDFYKLKYDYVNDNRFFSFKNYEILSNYNDAKTNNLSNIILSRPAKNSDFIEQNTFNFSFKEIGSLSTTLSVLDNINNAANAFFVGVDNSRNIVTTVNLKENYNYIFRIDFGNSVERTCKIYTSIKRFRVSLSSR